MLTFTTECSRGSKSYFREELRLDEEDGYFAYKRYLSKIFQFDEKGVVQWLLLSESYGVCGIRVITPKEIDETSMVTHKIYLQEEQTIKLYYSL